MFITPTVAQRFITSGQIQISSSVLTITTPSDNKNDTSTVSSKIIIPEEIYEYLMSHCISEIKELKQNCISLIHTTDGRSAVAFTFTTNDSGQLKTNIDKFQRLYANLKTEVHHVPEDVDWKVIQLVAATNEETHASLVCNDITRTCIMVGPDSKVQRLKRWFTKTLETNLRHNFQDENGACSLEKTLPQNDEGHVVSNDERKTGELID